MSPTSGSGSSIPSFTTANTSGSAATVTITATPTLNGCVGSPTAVTTITVNPNATLAFAAGAQKDQAVCAGQSISNINFTLGGGATSPVLTPTGRGISLSGNSVTGTPTGTATINYSISVTGVGGCTPAPITGTITINPLPTATLTGGATYCEGDAVSHITATFAGGTAPYSFTATGNGVTSGTTTGGSSTANLTNPVPSASGTYTYTLASFRDNNNCAGTSMPAAQTITINPKPAATINAPNLEYCAGTGGVNLSLTFTTPAHGTSGSPTYQWKRNGANVSPNGTNASLSNATAGTYTVVINRQGCEYTTPPVTISENPLPAYTITGAGEYCPTETSKTPVVVTFTTGTMPVTFNLGGSSRTTDASGVFTLPNPAGSAGGTTYQPTGIKDAKGCDGTPTASVAVIDKPTQGLVSKPIADICVGKQASITIADYVFNQDGTTKPAAGAVKYTSSDGTINLTTGVLTLDQTVAKTYTITAILDGAVVQGGDCAAAITITVTTLPLPVATITTNDVCAGIPSALSATPANGNGFGSATYAWTISSGGNLSSASAAAPTILGTTAAGNYTIGLTVTDDKGCIMAAPATASVTIHAIPTAALPAVPALCEGDPAATITATITPPALATGGAGTWSANVSKASETTATFNPTTAQATPYTITYDFISSPANGSCAAAPVSTTVLVNPNATVEFAAGAQPNQTICLNQSIENIAFVMGGGASSPVLTPAGNGLTLTPNATGGSIGGAPTAAGDINYTIAVTGVGGCTPASITGKITVNPLPTASLSGQAIYCEGDAISPIVVTFAGGTSPYSFTATGDGVASGSAPATTAHLTNAALPVAPGTYTYTLASFQDNNGCAGASLPNPASQTITINPTPVATINAPELEYCAGTGGVTLSLTFDDPDHGSTGAPTFQWKKGGANVTSNGTSATLTGATAGAYTCVITRLNCTFETESVTIIENPLPVYTITGAGSYCPTGATKDPVVVTFTIGAMPVAFTLNGNSVTTGADGKYTLSNPPGALAPGTEYKPTNIKDSNGCEGVSAASVAVIDKPTEGLTSKPIADLCVGTATTINIASYVFKQDGVTPATGVKYTTPDGTINLTTGVLTLSTTEAKTYTITAELDAGQVEGAECATAITLTVTTLPLPTAVITTNNECFGTASALSAALANGNGFSSAIYAWTISSGGNLNSTSASAPTILGTTPAGDYTIGLTLTDDKGCVIATPATASVTIHDIPVITLSEALEFCEGDPSATITATITPAALTAGGAGTWSSNVAKVTETTATFNPAAAQTAPYVVTYDFVSSAANGSCPAVQKTVNMTVHGNPTFTIAPSRASACEVDALNPNVPITITVTPTAPTTAGQMGNAAGRVFSGATGINTATGAFDSKDQTGTKTITLNYEDANGCKGSATTTFSIDPLPAVSFTTNPSEVCWNAGEITLNVSPAGGVFSGGGVNPSTGAFTAMVAGGVHTFNYLYTDANGCKSDDDLTITSIPVPVPERVDKSIQIQSDGKFPTGENTNLTATLPAGADALQWFNDGDCDATSAANSKIIFTGLTYMTGKTEADGEGSYPYRIRSSKTIAGGTCYSTCAPAILNITECPAQAPEAKNAHYCFGQDGKLTALDGSYQTAGYVAWFDKNPVGMTGENLGTPAGAITRLGSGTNYTSTDKGLGQQTVYLAEYDPGKDCWSVGRAITIDIHAIPAPTVAASKTKFCAANEDVTFTLTPDPNSFGANVVTSFTQTTTTFDGFSSANRSWNAMADAWNVNPAVNSTAERTIEVTYDIKVTHGLATEVQATCEASKVEKTTAHFMIPPPTQPDKYWLIGDIANIKPNFMTAATSSTGMEIAWYNTDGSEKLESNSLTLSPNPTALQAEVNAAGATEEYEKIYYITQTNALGCESEQTAIKLQLVNCPFQAPAVVDNDKCKKELPAQGMPLQAAKPATTNETPTAWHWYTSATGSATVTGAPTTGGNSSTFSSTEKSTISYWVSYSAVEQSSQQVCESKRTEVTLTVHLDPVINSLAQDKATTLCNTDEADLITADVTWNNTGVSSKWSIVGQAGGITDAGGNIYAKFDPSTWGEVTRDYTVQYEVTNNNGCKDTATFVVPVQFSPAPTTVDYTQAPTPGATVQVSATGLGDGTYNAEKVNWYASNTSIPALSSANPFPTGDDPAVRIPYPGKQYFATQVIRSCESKRTAAVVVIDCPVPAPKVTDRIICNYFADPELTVEPNAFTYGTRPAGNPEEYRFYSTLTGGAVIGTAGADGKWIPQVPRPASGDDQVRYYVSEYNKDAQPAACEGPRAEVIVYIRDVAPVAITKPADICEYEATPQFAATGITSVAPAPTVGWYYAAPSKVEGAETTPDGTGNPFTSNFSGPGTYNIWATQSIKFTNPGLLSDVITCVSNAATTSLLIKPQPAPPALVENETCYNTPNTALTASGAGVIQWYKNNVFTGKMGNSFTPEDKVPGTYTYQATQTVLGCESDKNSTTYRIKEIPAAPALTISSTQICSYDNDPTIDATLPPLASADNPAATILWYSAQNSADRLPQFDGQTNITANRNISLQYFATQTVEGCTSPFARTQYTVIPAVPMPATFSAVMCENTEDIPLLRTNAPQAKWYKTKVDLPNAPTETPVNSGTTYRPPMIPMETTTFYVQDNNQGCLSPMAPVAMTVIPQPTMTIGDNVAFCLYNEIEVEARDLVPVMAAPSRIDWLLTNDGAFHRQMPTETNGDKYFVTLNSGVLPTPGNYTLTAVYHVVTNSSYGNITCSSDPSAIKVTMNPRPNPPIVASKIICQGTVLEPIQAFGSPSIQWIYEKGPMELPNWIGDSYDFNRFGFKEIKVGQYFFTLFDTDVTTNCESLSTDLNFEVAPAANTKIVGRTELCAATSLEEPYSIDVVPTAKSNYYWSTSGDVYNYSKDGNPYSPSRYVDWHKAGIDTVYVYERTWAGCEGYDTLPVYIAPYPVAHYLWTLPGASTTIEFLDNSTQAPIVSRYSDEVDPIPLEYTMFWNFDRIPALNKNHIDMEVEYADRKQPITVENYTYGYKYPVLTVTNEFGCSDTYTTEIFVDIRAGLFMPNAFSPTNAAASVRVFKPIAFNLEYCKLWIYDKWGNLLFFSENVQNGMFADEWNGTYNGELLQSDVYIWKLEAKFLDGTTWPGQKKPAGGYTNFGSVMLIR